MMKIELSMTLLYSAFTIYNMKNLCLSEVLLQSCYQDNLRVYCRSVPHYTGHSLYFVKVVLKVTSAALELADAGVTCSGEKVRTAIPRIVLARMVAVAAVEGLAATVVVAAAVILRDPTICFGAILDAASVGTTDDMFVNRGVTIATVLTTGASFVPGVGFINDGPPGLQMLGCDGPKIASNKYATRDPAVRPIL
jgi:hypothetical protein